MRSKYSHDETQIFSSLCFIKTEKQFVNIIFLAQYKIPRPVE